MAEEPGTVAQAIRGLAHNAVHTAAEEACLSPAVAARLVEKAWSDSHLFGLLVMLLHLMVSLSLLVAFGASHDKDLDWAFKQYLDNFADACSIATIGLAYYGASLIQFNFRGHYFEGYFVAEFRANPKFPEFSSNILFEFLLKALLCGSGVVLVVAFLTFYFGSGRHFREYVQMYTDEVADVCSIICFTDWIAFSLAFQATNGALATAVTVAERKIAERNRRKKFDRIYLERFLQIGITWLLFVAAASQFMTSASVKKELGILAVAKEYLDEAADVASICLFALFVSSVMSSSALVSQLFNNIHPNGDNRKAVHISPQNMAVAAVITIIAIVLLKTPQDLPPFAATSLFKHHLDQVADICSILTVFGFVYYNHRMSSLTWSLSQVLGQHIEVAPPTTPKAAAQLSRAR